MSTIDEAVDVNVPVRTAYDQWTQFETFPAFMGSVVQVVQLSDALTHWVTSVAGARREFDAQITEQHPDERVAWTVVGQGPRLAGVTTFQPVDSDRCRVVLRMRFDPSGLAESLGDAVGGVRRQVRADLHRFKEFIEGRGTATGAWRGTIELRQVP